MNIFCYLNLICLIILEISYNIFITYKKINSHDIYRRLSSIQVSRQKIRLLGSIQVSQQKIR